MNTTGLRSTGMAAATAVWGLRGKVVHGHARGGSQLGFPTANVAMNDAVVAALTPMKNGVFCGFAAVETEPLEVLPMVMSVGFNPHFKDQTLTAEVHFVHKFEKDFYVSVIRVAAIARLREQKQYDSLQGLIDDIRNDCRNGVEAVRQHVVAGAEYIAALAPADGAGDETRFEANLQPRSKM